MNKLKKALKELERSLTASRRVKVGFLKGATYPDGQPVAQVAAWNEWGDPARGRPPRPFFRNMVQSESPKWGKRLALCLQRTGYDVDKALGMMGEDISGALRESIATFTSPELAPSTIARKGFDKPLVNTGHMMRSISWEIVDGS